MATPSMEITIVVHIQLIAPFHEQHDLYDCKIDHSVQL